MRRAAALAAALAFGCLACQPEPSDQRLVVGDSLTMTAALAGGFPAGWDIHSMIGWQAEDAQPGVAERVADPDRSPCAAAIALGHNDARDGWTVTDAQQMATLRATLHPATAVVWVLPDYTGTDPVWAAGIAAYRTWVTGEAARHGDDVVDWRTHHTAADIDADGAHLTPAGQLRYGQLITEEMPPCG